ncbi:hypothetical protein [Marinigracilibium pacificum]|uniref:Quercetin 2,3-dioxygenase C-terminal cupin domain-containing protein n=1 Tax=Marinigracilibium pacificum TaxID=2729599 RepID=A0A848J5V7_9BACT|nr:hypothetical protein [Marinigracilibium pacificum]NMM49854.1 hypothetical protein [Marinigracilibium pacificum]
MKVKLIDSSLRNKVRHTNFTAWHDYLPSFKHQGSLVMVYKELLWPGARYQIKNSHDYTIVQCSLSGKKLLKNSHWEATVNEATSVIHRLYPETPIESINAEEILPYFGYQFWFNSMSNDVDSTLIQLNEEDFANGEMMTIYEAGDNGLETHASLKYGSLSAEGDLIYKPKTSNSKVYIHLIAGKIECANADELITMNNEDSLEVSQIDQIVLKPIKDSRLFIIENTHS